MTEPDFRIRRQKPLGMQVYEQLRGMMQARIFEPGDRMVEEDLARRLSVSRTPVREALFRLELNGLVEQQDGRFVVPTLTLRDIHEIFQIRRLLEPQAVATLAPGLSAGDIAEFQAAAGRVAAAQSQDAASAANITFRGLWMARIQNQRLHEMLARFDDQVILVRRSTLRDPAARQAAAEGVGALARAFAARDAEAAHRAMTAFVDTALEWFERAVSDGATPDA